MGEIPHCRRRMPALALMWRAVALCCHAMTISEPARADLGHRSDEIVSAIRLLQSRNYVVLAPPDCIHGSRPDRLRLEYDLRLLTYDGSQIDLSPYHVRIVRLLLAANDSWCSRDRLCLAIWGDAIARSNALSVHMFEVQQRLRRLTGLGRPILSMRHVGFRLAPELFA